MTCEFCIRHMDDVLTVKVGGLMGLERFALVVDRIGEALKHHDARSVLVDSRGAVLAFGPLDYPEALAICARSSFGHVPVAIVTSRELTRLGMAFSRAIAAFSGRLRAVFTDYERAAAWAGRRREHWPWAPVSEGLLHLAQCAAPYPCPCARERLAQERMPHA